MARGMVPDYCVVGHVACDLLSDGESRAGGTVTFAALAAARLGYQVGVLTSAGLRHAGRTALGDIEGAQGVTVVSRLSQGTTTFENTYAGNERRQVLRGSADALRRRDLPEGWLDARVLHLGPIAHEIDVTQARAMLEDASGLRGLTPQGWLRRWDARGHVVPGPWEGMEALLPLADVVILSPEDVGDQTGLLDRIIRLGRLVVVTMADRGACVYQNGRETSFPAFVADVVDPTGAGDLFAVAFMLRLAETEAVAEAARYANCAASFVVEGVGTSNLPSRDQIAHRLKHGKLIA